MKNLCIFLLIWINLHLALHAATTRYYVGGGTAYGNDGTKWSLSSGGTPIGGTISWQIDDIAIFDANSGTGIVVLINAIGTIGKLYIYGNQTITVKGDGVADRILDIDTEASETFYLGGGSTFIIVGASNGKNLRINMNSGTTANIYGYLKVTDDNSGYGEFSKSSGGTINFYSGSTYEHGSKESGSDLPEAIWNSGSICLITGSTGSKPGNLDQSFGNFIWDCASQSGLISFTGDFGGTQSDFTVESTNGNTLRFTGSESGTISIGRDFIMKSGCTFIIAQGGADVTLNIGRDFIMYGGDFRMSDASNSDVVMNVNRNFTFQGTYFRLANDDVNISLNIKGNFTMTSGFFQYTITGSYGNVNFNGNTEQLFTKSGGTINNKVNFTVKNGAILNLANQVLGDYSYTTGTFTLESGATIKTTHSNGITSSGASGCIQNNGSRSFHDNAHYHYYANGSQTSGNGLPSSIGGTLTIGTTSNATQITLSKNTTVNNKLIVVSNATTNSNIISGTLLYGSSGTLEYQGASTQTTANGVFPSSSGPGNLVINNTNGVILHDSRTLNGNLSLTAGVFSISGNTLTLNGAINKTGGDWSGGSSSNLVMGGTGASTNLPAITLKDLTINRTNGITLAGNVNINGTAYMTKGSLSPGGYQLLYGINGNLDYNGTSAQTMGNAEFPAANGPASIYYNNTSQVNLHASRNYSGTIYLNSGTFYLGNNTLTFTGNFQQTNGVISGGSSGHLIFDENINQGILPGNSNLYYLTINTSGGVAMNGNSTIQITLTLTGGNFSIGENQLTLNGSLSQSSGILTGGISSAIVFGGTGTATTLPEIVLKTLVINRPNGINLGGSVTIKDLLTLTAGILNIGSNTLYIDGSVSATSGILAGSNSTLQINESSKKVSTDLPQAELANLYITRADGVNMTGNITVHEALTIYSGDMNIGSNTLSLNGTLTENTGRLVAGSSSGLNIGGSASILTIRLTELNNLGLTRPAGMRLDDQLKIWGTFTLSNCPIELNGNAIAYGHSGTLHYRGFSSQETSDTEWPEEEGPQNVTIQNLNGVSMDKDRSVPGILQILAGSFLIGSNTLTIGNNLIVLGSGILEGSTSSNLRIEGMLMIQPINLPQVTLNNLAINRPGGEVWLHGNLNLYGTLTFENGNLQISNQILSLRNPVAGMLDNLKSSSTSSLEITGDAGGMNIGATENIRVSELNMLTISNTNTSGVSLNGTLNISGSLIISSGAKFNVETGRFLTIMGSLLLDDDESLVLKSSTDATASMIINGLSTPEKKIRSERYIQGYTSSTDGWHLLGSPVNNLLVEGSPFEPGDPDDLYTYDEIQNLWLNYKVTGNFTHFQAGTGYLVASHENETKWFSGELFNQNITFHNFSYTEERGWHLLGNPFTCGVRWNDGMWNLVNVDATAKLWQESIHNYIDIDPGNHIPPHNGFFIHVSNAINSITISQFSREHTPHNWYKNQEIPCLKITAQSLENNTATICRIRFSNESTSGFDKEYDSHYLPGFQEPPAFYSRSSCGRPLSTNTLPFNEDESINLEFTKGVSASYTMTVDGIETFPQQVILILRDEKLNYTVNLRNQNTYTFSSHSGDYPQRFKLMFSNNTGITDIPPCKEPLFYLADRTIILNLNDGYSSENGQLELLDVSGRCFQQHDELSSPFVIKSGIERGIYIVRLTIDEKVVSEKILLW